IWQRRRSATPNASGAPGVVLPRDQRAVFVGPDLHTRVSRRTAPCRLQLRFTVEHHLYRLCVHLLRELSGGYAPGVKTELAAKASTDMVLVDMDIRGRKIDGFAKLLSD